MKPSFPIWQSSSSPVRKEEVMLTCLQISHACLTRGHLLYWQLVPVCTSCENPLLCCIMSMDVCFMRRDVTPSPFMACCVKYSEMIIVVYQMLWHTWTALGCAGQFKFWNVMPFYDIVLRFYYMNVRMIVSAPYPTQHFHQF
jgi:hypothetical protein